MSSLKERQKAEAVERMKRLGILEQAIKEFEEEGKLKLSEIGVTISRGFLRLASCQYWLTKEEQKMVDEFEKEHNGLVYHVIRGNTNIGLLYNLLFVSEHAEEWPMDIEDIGQGQALAYVINMDMPDCSEFGTIGIVKEPLSSGGGLIRTW